MSKSILGFLLFLFLTCSLKAEQPIFNISSADANNGEIIDINFNVDDFSNIISAQFSINWNPDVLTFRAIKNFNPSVNGLSPSNFNIVDYIDEGKITFGWFESSLNPITIPDGSLFFTIEFEVVGSPCESTPVAITNDPLEIEVAEENEVPVGLVSNNGQVSVPGVGCAEGIDFNGSSVNGACGSESCISFTVDNFIDVASMEFSLVYDPAVIQFDHFQNFAPLLGFGQGNTNLLSPGLIRVVWFNSNAENETLPDGTTLFEICFDVIGAGGQSSTINFGNDPAVMIADVDQNLHTVNIQPASITAQCQLEGFALIGEAVCTEPNGIICMDVSINDFDDIVALQFSINWDSTKFVFDHLEGFNLPDLDEGSFGTPINIDVDEGEVTVSWFDMSLQGVTLPDFDSIFLLCLRAVGPAGTSSPITFSQTPLEIEIATLDSVLTNYGLIQGSAEIKLDCEGCSINYTLDATSPTCPGQSNGSLNLTLNTDCPGTPTYLWSYNGASTQDLSGIPAGSYTVTITIGSPPQIIVATQVVSDPASMSVTGTITNPVPAGGNNGAINITVTGGTPPYSFVWSNTFTTEDLANITAGTYTVTVTDNKGCTFVPDPFIVGADLAGAVTHVSCFGSCNGSITVSAAFGTPGYTYLWNTVPAQTTQTINNLCPGSYCVTVTDSGGSTRDTCFTVTQPSALTVTADITHDVNENGQGAIDLNVVGGINPITYVWSPGGATTQDIINLPGGEYCVTITYGANCTYNTCFTVFSGNIGLTLNVLQYGNFQTSCHDECDGEITSVVSGAVEPVTYLWSNNATTADLTGLCPGIYSLTITDASGKSASATRTITAPPALSLSVIKTDPTDISASDGSISVQVVGGVAPHSYQWVGPVTGNTASMNNLPAGTYNITVIDANDCEFTATVILGVEGVPCYAANKIITPNSDGKNDYFTIQCIFDAPNRLFIFNRNGGLVYETDNYTNTWTGVDNDNELLPDGGYMWVLEIINPSGPRILKGTVNVLRTAD